MSATKLKASERQAIIQKLVGVLKKKYGKAPAEGNRPVLQTLIFAACLEDASAEDAEVACQRLLERFHDLNEIRVSSISEIEQALEPLPDSDWRALRIRDTLQTVFETYFQFDLDSLKRKTHEVAVKDLMKIRYASPFMRLYVLQHCLGSHVVPLDGSTLAALVYLGLVSPDTSVEQASEDLKSAIRKPETSLVCHVLRSLATDPKYHEELKLTRAERESGVDPTTAVDRLNQLLTGRRKAAIKKAALVKTRKKPAPKEPARRPKVKAKTAAKAVKKKVTKKPARKR